MYSDEFSITIDYFVSLFYKKKEEPTEMEYHDL